MKVCIFSINVNVVLEKKGDKREKKHMENFVFLPIWDYFFPSTLCHLVPPLRPVPIALEEYLFVDWVGCRSHAIWSMLLSAASSSIFWRDENKVRKIRKEGAIKGMDPPIWIILLSICLNYLTFCSVFIRTLVDNGLWDCKDANTPCRCQRTEHWQKPTDGTCCVALRRLNTSVKCFIRRKDKQRQLTCTTLWTYTWEEKVSWKP